MEREAGKPGSFNDCSERLIGACIEVHRYLGPGLLESVYEECLCHELNLLGVTYERQRWLPIRYKGIQLLAGYRLDLVGDREILVEIKAVTHLLPVHEAQVLTYLKLTGLPTGLLVNFHTPAIKRDLRRLTNKRTQRLPGFRLPLSLVTAATSAPASTRARRSSSLPSQP